MIDPKRVDRQVKAWYTMGRVAPFGALFVLCLALFFDLHTYVEYLLAGVAVIFAIFAFAWWWWVLDTVRKLFSMLDKTHQKFDEVLDDLTSLKQDLNDSNRKRPKSPDDKSK